MIHDPVDIALSIVIPCKNERGNLRSVIDQLPRFHFEYEIIIVEGHSSDGTFELAQEIKKSLPDLNIHIIKQTGKGKANAVEDACAQAQGRYIIIVDADLTVPPSAVGDCFTLLNTDPHAFVNGCRLSLAMEKGAMPFINRMGNTLSAIFFSWYTGDTFKDTLCGLKGFSKVDYLKMPTANPFYGRYDPFGDFDLIVGAYFLKLKIIQLPIYYTSRRYGTSQISRLKDTLPLIQLCFKLVIHKITKQC